MKIYRLLPLLGLVACEAEDAAFTTAQSALPDVHSDTLAEDADLAAPSEDVADLPEDEPAIGEPDALRRLSAREYQNAIAELYDIDIALSALPADSDSFGFENDRRGQYITTQLVDAYVDLGAALAQEIVDAHPDRVPCLEEAEDDEADLDTAACLEELIVVEGEGLFRRPVSETLRDDLLTLATEALPEDASYRDRVLLTLQAMLISPEFLYLIEQPADPDAARGVPVVADSYTVAARLASFLWESVPDEALMVAAADGSLQTPEGLDAQIERMIADPRFRGSQARFVYNWLHIEKLDIRTKKTEDNLDEALRAAAVEEVERFVNDILIAGEAPFEDIFLSTEAFVNGRLGALYEVDAGEGWTRTDLPERPGLLTRFGFLAAHGHPDRPSPVLRGVVVNERLFCRAFPPPPANAESAAAEVADGVSLDDLTNREMYELTTQQGSCNDCHQFINPPGFALEQFDTMGRFQLTEGNGLAINPVATVADLGEVLDATHLMEQLAVSPTVQDCAARHWLRFAAAGERLEEDEALRAGLVGQLSSGLPFGQIAGWIAKQPSFSTVVVPE